MIERRNNIIGGGLLCKSIVIFNWILIHWHIGGIEDDGSKILPRFRLRAIYFGDWKVPLKFYYK